MFRPAALLAAAAILFGASGCADTSWSFKTDSKTLSNGQWIYFTLSAYSAAENELNSTQSEESSENFSPSHLKSITLALFFFVFSSCTV